jgi:hypothetical protein
MYPWWRPNELSLIALGRRGVALHASLRQLAIVLDDQVFAIAPDTLPQPHSHLQLVDHLGLAANADRNVTIFEQFALLK